jgi:prophage regulatory protein
MISQKLSLSKPTIYRKIAAKNFPAPIKIGRSSRWREEDVNAWIEVLSDIPNVGGDHEE